MQVVFPIDSLSELIPVDQIIETNALYAQLIGQRDSDCGFSQRRDACHDYGHGM